MIFIDENKIIQFGKHKLRNVADVIANDFGYIQWARNQPWAKEDPLFQKVLCELKEQTLIPFGKHRNKSIEWLKLNDPKYADWAIHNRSIIEKYPDIIVELMKKTVKE